MKKLFTAVPMKKLLLATSLVAMSSTSIAANTSEDLDATVTDAFTVTAKYVLPITVGLDKSTISFGDVWTDSVITPEAVIATVTGEANETFNYTIASSGSLVTFAGTDYSLTETEGVEFSTTATTQKLNFTVGLNTANAATAGTIAETITVSVNYNAIADTTSS
jgi:hypothetical protein